MAKTVKVSFKAHGKRVTFKAKVHKPKRVPKHLKPFLFKAKKRRK